MMQMQNNLLEKESDCVRERAGVPQVSCRRENDCLLKTGPLNADSLLQGVLDPEPNGSGLFVLCL